MLPRVKPQAKAGPEKEKATDVVRGILRTIFRVSKISGPVLPLTALVLLLTHAAGIEQKPGFTKFSKQIALTGSIKHLVAEIQAGSA